MSTQLDTFRRYVTANPVAAAAPDRRVIMVGSGKGGVGTSTVAALLGITAAASGLEVLLVDADERMGCLAWLLGVHPERTHASLLGGGPTPEQLVARVGETLSLLPIGGTAIEPELTSGQRRALLRRVESIYARYDLVVVDAGSRLESIHTICAYGPGRLLAVTGADRISVAATYALVKAVGTRFPATKLEVLVNRLDGTSSLATFAEIRTATGEFLRSDVGFAGSVPDDESLRAGVGAGMPVQEAAVGSPAAAACQQIGIRIGREVIESPAPLVATRPSHWR